MVNTNYEQGKQPNLEYFGYIISLIISLLFLLNIFPSLDFEFILGLLLFILILISLFRFRIPNLFIEFILILCIILSFIPFIGVFFSLLGFILALFDMMLYKSSVFYKIVEVRTYSNFSNKKKPQQPKKKSSIEKDNVIDAEYKEK